MHRVEINFDVYMKIMNQKTSLNQEIRRFLLGIQGSLKEMAANGKLAVQADSDAEEDDD